MGPTLSIVQQSAIAPARLTRPNVGRKPVTPQRVLGEMIDPRVSVPSEKATLRKWQCELCAFVYDEAVGMPEDGITAGTRWEDVPESWTCPDCGASKSDFQMVEV